MSDKHKKNYKTIAFQGTHGAFSDLSCRTVFPDLETVPCHSFDDAFNAVLEGQTDLAMIPVDNTIAGRVADVHHLMQKGDLFIIGEHFQLVDHCLLALPGTEESTLKHVHSHVHALPQCRKLIKELGLEAHVHSNTAAAAQHISQTKKPEHAAIASSLAAEIYGLDILRSSIQDEEKNTTRFLIMAKEPETPPQDSHVLSSLIFDVRSIPASLYKCLGGFATNGLSMTKLESYIKDDFQTAEFYMDVEAHPESEAFQLALEELGFYAKEVKFLGSYPAHEYRKKS